MKDQVLQILNLYYGAEDPAKFESQYEHNKKVADEIVNQLAETMRSDNTKIVTKKLFA